jgi:hypothetical protein
VSQRSGLPDAPVAAAPGMIRGADDLVHVRGEEGRAQRSGPRVNLVLRVGDGAVLHGSYTPFCTPPSVEGVLSSGRV